MQIICPHCTTSYAVDPTKFGAGGRTVRCARCGETWLAQAQEEAYALAEAPNDLAGWGESESFAQHDDPPHIDSPSIAGDWTDDETTSSYSSNDDTDWPEEPQGARSIWSRLTSAEWLHSLVQPLARHVDHPRMVQLRDRLPHAPAVRLPKISLPAACTLMGALAAALIIWRADVVRLMPQTGAFFKTIGLGVNLRGLEFDKLKVTNETVDGKSVLVIEGAITDVARKAVELPRLRFIVRDANGADLYAWNSILEQSVLKPGEKLAFRSRLASPPAEGREITVRFFQRRDVAGGI